MYKIFIINEEKNGQSEYKLFKNSKMTIKGKNTIHVEVKKSRNIEGYIKTIWKFS